MERVRVGDVLSLERRPVAIDPSSDYTFLGMSASGGGFFMKPPTPGTAIRPGSAFTIKPGDFVYSRLFAWRGSFELAGPSDATCVVSGEFPTFAVDESRVDARWLRYWFLSEDGLREVGDRSAGSTPGSRNRLREDRFLSIPVRLPVIDEQRRVADRLDRLQAAATELRHRSDCASTLSCALAVSASARPDLDDEAKSRAGWRRVRLGAVLELNNREVLVESGTSYDIAGVYSFGRGLFRRAALDGSQTSYKTLHQLRSDRIVMSRLKAWEGALALVPTYLDGWFVSPEFPTFDVDSEQVDAQFLGALLTSERFWSRLKSASQGIGARRERVNASRLLEQEVQIPPLEEQRLVARMIQGLQTLQTRRDRASERIASLVPAALNQAFASFS